MAQKPIYINDNGTVRELSELHVNDNGTVREITEGFINDNGTIRHIWSKAPYAVGTNIFTYSWANGDDISNFSSNFSTYPLAFTSAPAFIQGSGTPDSRIQFTLASGFTISNYTQAEHGSGNDLSRTGQTYVIFVGNTVSGLSGVPGIAGSGNGGSSFQVRYVG